MQTIARIETPPRDNQDLLGVPVPKIFRRAREAKALCGLAGIEAVRCALHVIEAETWKDPAKYGRDVEDEYFPFAKLSEMGAQEVCWYVIGIPLKQARNIRDVAQIIGWEKVTKLPARGIELIARCPSGAQAVAAHINGKELTEADVVELLRPHQPQGLSRRKLPVLDDERKMFEMRLRELQQEFRKYRRAVEPDLERLKKDNKSLREDLASARSEIADLQSRLFDRSAQKAQ